MPTHPELGALYSTLQCETSHHEQAPSGCKDVCDGPALAATWETERWSAANAPSRRNIVFVCGGSLCNGRIHTRNQDRYFLKVKDLSKLRRRRFVAFPILPLAKTTTCRITTRSSNDSAGTSHCHGVVVLPFRGFSTGALLLSKICTGK